MAQKPMARPTARNPIARKPVAGTPAVLDQADPPPRAQLEFQPVVHVSDMPASVAFFLRLGAGIVHGRPEDDWVLLQMGAVQISLIAGSPPTADACPVELNFGVVTPIEQLQRVLPGARLTTDRTFGRRLLVRSPDGLLIRINQREPGVT